jgi:hypothetical protein
MNCYLKLKTRRRVAMNRLIVVLAALAAIALLMGPATANAGIQIPKDAKKALESAKSLRALETAKAAARSACVNAYISEEEKDECKKLVSRLFVARKKKLKPTKRRCYWSNDWRLFKDWKASECKCPDGTKQKMGTIDGEKAPMCACENDLDLYVSFPTDGSACEEPDETPDKSDKCEVDLEDLEIAWTKLESALKGIYVVDANALKNLTRRMDKFIDKLESQPPPECSGPWVLIAILLGLIVSLQFLILLPRIQEFLRRRRR